MDKKDIQWLITDCKRRNGIMEEHIHEGIDYRKQVVRNTTWRHAYKILVGFGFMLIMWILKTIYTQ